MTLSFFSSWRPLVVLLLCLCICYSGLALAQAAPQQARAGCGTIEAPLRIMPLGDSITESKRGYSSYRLSLWRNLRAAGCKINLVGSRRGVSVGFKDRPSTTPQNPNFDQDHEGHWGYRVDQILNFLPTRLQISQPDIVLIHLGSNDLFQNQSVASTIAELGAVIDTIQETNPNAITVIAQLIPSRRSASSIRALNSRVPQLAKSRHSATHPVVVVNMYRDFSLSLDIQRDGIHPNNNGDSKLGARFATTILQTLEGDEE